MAGLALALINLKTSDATGGLYLPGPDYSHHYPRTGGRPGIVHLAGLLDLPLY